MKLGENLKYKISNIFIRKPESITSKVLVENLVTQRINNKIWGDYTRIVFQDIVSEIWFPITSNLEIN